MGFKGSNGYAIDNLGRLSHGSFKQVADISATVNKLTAFDGAASDNYGRTVAVGSGKIVVGSYYDDDLGNGSGSAYVYNLDGNLVTKLTAYDGAASDFYGSSVAVGNGRIVVGSPYDDDMGSGSGSVYVYDLNQTLITKLTAYDGADTDIYGWSVSVGNGRIVVGAYGDDDLGSLSGSAYIYDLDGNFITKLTAFDGAAYENYGYLVTVGNGRIVIGSYGSNYSGCAYVYDLNGALITKLVAFDSAADDEFGNSISVGSGRIVIGSHRNSNSNGSYSGSAYIYDLDGNFITKLIAFDGAAYENYGKSVSIGNGRIVIGSLSSDLGSYSGSAYIYDLDYNLITKLTAFDGAAYDQFGYSVSVGNGRIVIGSYQDDDMGSSSGSAYVYEFSESYDTYIENQLN